jgi:hypothetical protein
MHIRESLVVLFGATFALAAAGADTDAPGGLRVRALGCFFEVPASYTLVADPGDRIEFIAPLAAGSITIEPLSSIDINRLSEVSSRTQGHLTIVDLTDHDAREPLLLTIIHNRLQAVSLWRAARALAPGIVGACLANVHPRAPGAPTKEP